LDEAVGLSVRLFRLVWGDEFDRALRPVRAVSFVESMLFSAAWSFIGIWAIAAAVPGALHRRSEPLPSPSA
jgi:hypothetical protein